MLGLRSLDRISFQGMALKAKELPKERSIMERWLNYHHLYYFWVIAKRGSVTEACEELRLSQPAVSAQLKSLEESLGHKLFERHARGLTLTEFGHIALKYAEEIFTLGNEFLRVLDGSTYSRLPVLHVGIADVVPKILAYRLIETVLDKQQRTRIICHEDKTEILIADLALQKIDLILCDSSIPQSTKVKAFSHFLGECGVTFLAKDSLAKQLKRGFPHSLDSKPLMLPTDAAAIRRPLDSWFEEQGIRPQVLMEFQDSALMEIFAQGGHGVIPVPSNIEDEVMNDYGLKLVGRTDEVKEKFYLISLERKIKNPLISQMVERSQSKIFG